MKFSRMMRCLFFVIFLMVSHSTFANEKELVFGIYFENSFRNEHTSVLINGVMVAKNIELRPARTSPSSLILTQTRYKISVQPYHREKTVVRAVEIKNSTLNLGVSIDRIWRNFSFDLRNGKYLFVDYSFIRIGWRILTVATMIQSRYGPIYI